MRQLQKVRRATIRRSRPSKALTELEGCVLGIVWDLGPCTPYTIRRVFLDSPSPYWTGSAGAIYPLVRRLEEHGLIVARPQATGKRQGVIYALSAKGTSRLRAWLEPPLPAWVIGVPMDALRTRFGFLAALRHDKEAAFLAEAAAGVRSHIEIAQKDCAKHQAAGDRVSYLMSRGALGMMRARLAWLEEIRQGIRRDSASRRAAGRGARRRRPGSG